MRYLSCLYKNSYCGQKPFHLAHFSGVQRYLISYFENWSPKQDVSGTEELSFLETDIDYIMNDPSILDLEDPSEQNNDGNIHTDTAVVPANDNLLEQNVNNITPPANTAIVTAPNNMNNKLDRSLMDKTFPQNHQICFPELKQDQEAVSALTPNSTASYADKPFAWLRGKCAFLNPKPEPGSWLRKICCCLCITIIHSYTYIIHY